MRSTSKNDNDEPLALTFGEAADKLHCSVNAVRRLAKAGLLKGFSLSGGTNIFTRVTMRSVREFVESAHGKADADGRTIRGQ